MMCIANALPVQQNLTVPHCGLDLDSCHATHVCTSCSRSQRTRMMLRTPSEYCAGTALRCIACLQASNAMFASTPRHRAAHYTAGWCCTQHREVPQNVLASSKALLAQGDRFVVSTRTCRCRVERAATNQHALKHTRHGCSVPCGNKRIASHSRSMKLFTDLGPLKSEGCATPTPDLLDCAQSPQRYKTCAGFLNLCNGRQSSLEMINIRQETQGGFYGRLIASK